MKLCPPPLKCKILKYYTHFSKNLLAGPLKLEDPKLEGVIGYNSNGHKLKVKMTRSLYILLFFTIETKQEIIKIF
jgi:hypothetical protein